MDFKKVILFNTSLICSLSFAQISKAIPSNNHFFDFNSLGYCMKESPLDVGQNFADNEFLFWDKSCYIFSTRGDYDCFGTNAKITIIEKKKIPGKFPSAGPTRAKIKWRDNFIWISKNGKIFRQISQEETDPYFKVMDTETEANDFDIDLDGRMLLFGTYNQKTGKLGALIESYDPETKTTNRIFDLPDHLEETGPSAYNKFLNYALCLNYEAVRIQEFVVLYNSLAKRVFIYSGINKKVMEVKLPFKARTPKDIFTSQDAPPTPLKGLCWQILPKCSMEAWLILPKLAFEHEGTDVGPEETDSNGYLAFPLNLHEATLGNGSKLRAGFPFYKNTRGELRPIEEALASYALEGNPEKGLPAPSQSPVATRPKVQ